MSTREPVSQTKGAEIRWEWLYKTSVGAALALAGLFLLAILSLLVGLIQPAANIGWLTVLENNWLMILFKLNAGFDGVQFGQLYGPDPLDLVILALVVILGLSLSMALRRTSRVWSMFAAVLPLLGIALFVITRLSGRSSVMAAVFVISAVMLRGKIFDRAVAVMGILASVLLLAGDFGTTGDSPFAVIATSIGIGYVLLTTWFCLVARRLFRLGGRHYEAG